MKTLLTIAILLVGHNAHSATVCSIAEEATSAYTICTDRNENDVFQYKNYYGSPESQKSQARMDAIRNLIEKGFKADGCNNFVRNH